MTKLQSLAVVTTLSPIKIQLRASLAFSLVQLGLIVWIADFKPVGSSEPLWHRHWWADRSLRRRTIHSH